PPPPAADPLRFLEPVAPREVLRDTLLDRMAPPSVLTDEALQVLYFHGDSSAYLAPADGEPTTDLLALLTPALVAPIRSAARQALEERRPVRVVGEHRGGVGAAPVITIVPIELPDSSRRL